MNFAYVILAAVAVNTVYAVAVEDINDLHKFMEMLRLVCADPLMPQVQTKAI